MLKELKEWHEEELADEIKYMEMSKVVPEEYRSIFRDISREEGSHARILEIIINDISKHCLVEEKPEEENTVVDEIKPTENKVVLDL